MGLKLKANYIIGQTKENYKGQFKQANIIPINKDQSKIELIEDAKSELELKKSEMEKNKAGANTEFSYPGVLKTKKSLAEQMSVIQSFRKREFNILISTSVSEEGFDIPSCNLVISFDAPTNARSFIQVKGRARLANSKYFIITHDSKKKAMETNIDKFIAEVKIVQFITRETDNMNTKIRTIKPKSVDFYQKLICPRSGACLNTNWSVALLDNYCSYFRQKVLNWKPIYHMFTVKNIGHKCYVRLPPFMKTQIIDKGEFCNRKEESIRSAAFEC
jgi:hypothetical protein